MIGVGGVVFVSVMSLISLYLNKVSDEWFSFVAFLLIWIFVLAKLIAVLISEKDNISFSQKKDWTLIIFWFAMYSYCIAGLFKLGIIKALPLYGVFAFIIFILTLALASMDVGKK